ncbi:hypothetical protein SLA2020_359670 [Shorea laevis]
MSFLNLLERGCSRAKAKTSGKSKFPFPISKRSSRHSQIKERLLRKVAMKNMRQSMKRLKREMEEISDEQRSIREGQKLVREKFQEMEEECKQLREETKMIRMQGRSTQLRLALMFQILKARENNDLPRATELTRFLRELIANRNRQN